jgi:ATP-dependent Clp protease adaptor protein ClpS
MTRAGEGWGDPEERCAGVRSRLPRTHAAWRMSKKQEGDDDTGGGGSTGTEVVTKPRAKTQKPRLYKVLLLNDDYTPMDFVVYVLEQFFNKSRSEATSIMLQVHRRGVGVCGVYTYEVAETKVSQVMSFARQNEHPLQCTMEKE